MGLFDNDDDYRRQEEAWRTVERARLHPEKHEAKLSHELIAGAASFAAAKMYEDKLEKEGKPVDHAFAKRLLAGFAGAYIDRLVETKGLDAWDEHKDKARVKEEAQRYYEEKHLQEYSDEAHQHWMAEHTHWSANGAPPPPVQYPPGYEPGFMRPQDFAPYPGQQGPYIAPPPTIVRGGVRETASPRASRALGWTSRAEGRDDGGEDGAKGGDVRPSRTWAVRPR
ncbi:hypothetical protein DFH07DRAFT_544603 [Mycena maculata]|uniref:CipC-like antibiotic response protein n=1 Tax=Mycena maculata TaxID=230809 RepID=A0AAD7N8W4_9AGAR|nr:hypothetical protein DFH07DRAFT_544603 [Mycena maculata]